MFVKLPFTQLLCVLINVVVVMLILLQKVECPGGRFPWMKELNVGPDNGVPPHNGIIGPGVRAPWMDEGDGVESITKAIVEAFDDEN